MSLPQGFTVYPEFKAKTFKGSVTCGKTISSAEVPNRKGWVMGTMSRTGYGKL